MSSPLQDTDQLNIQLEDDIWKQYRTSILGGLAVLIVAAVVGFFFYQSHTKTEMGAAELYLKSSTVETWKEVLEKYPKSSKAADSLLSLASDSVEKKNYEQALAYYKQFATTFSSHPAKEGVDLAIANCLESLGKKEEATAAYEKLFKNASYTYIGSATLGLARMYEASGKITEAKAALTAYVTKHPTGLSAREAHTTLNRLNNSKPVEVKK